ncbi:protease [Lactobacillus delbrueckii]|uniref:M48 family metallopeptidase n=1 Tax=Lactobacillus delbrueckii TaxID=1584 RepID=UPI001F2B1C39|nr:M48 family metallopeptidase [Lactobacillus delbrueckii]GHN37711.1 protease [Lactobacillus delbrueckii]
MLYQQIEQNKRNTWIVLGGFTALLLAIAGMLSVYLTFWAGMIFLAAGIIYMVYIYFYSTRHLMRITHAVEINQENVPQLYEMVEEMSLAAGIPMPKVYAIPSNIPNAFATGRDPEHASLAVTSGLVKIMNHDELLGVIGHEISHIRNYDLRVTTITSALSSFIYLAAVYLLALGWTLFKMDGGVVTKCICWFFGSIALAVGAGLFIVALPIAKLLNLSMSRQREYLADIGSVDLTRNPKCIVGALKKLEAIEQQYQQQKENPMVLALAFNNFQVKHWWTNLISDHPTLDRRIDRLEHTADLPK